MLLQGAGSDVFVASRICDDLEGFARILQDLQGFGRICEDLVGFARICKDLVVDFVGNGPEI